MSLSAKPSDKPEDLFLGAVLFGLLTKLSYNNENFMVESAGEKLSEESSKKLFFEIENLHLDDSLEFFF